MLKTTPARPDPDFLLAQMQAHTLRKERGKLRIYFGASAGVGKTYAMLTAARRIQEEGRTVLVGVVETHGRSETALQVGNLELLPLKKIVYRNRILPEFDLDAALQRHPSLILMDELAHTNAPGARHPKRWQDVEELLVAGIDVYTTINVQHLESLNDVVGGITGIRVTEIVPDPVFDHADEVVLVDIPADELLSRLKSGRVYQGTQIEHASQNFFRKGNLMALRELALRRTADRVDNDVQAYRIEKSISAVWKTGIALLACIGPREGAEHLIRSATRMATQLNAEWHVIYVETPALQRLSSRRRESILNAMQIAEKQGAKIAVLSGTDIAEEIVRYARTQNFSQIILGRNPPPWPWQTSLLQRLATLAPDMDVTVLGRTPDTATTPGTQTRKNTGSSAEFAPQSTWQRPRRYSLAAAASLITALLAMPLLPHLDLANIVMLFLLTVVLVAVRLGRGPAVVSTVVGVAAFDFFFVTPRFSFAVSDVQYLVTFSVMLVVGLITAHLTSNLRYQARVASHRELRARALYQFARDLSGVLETEQILNVTQHCITHTFNVKATLLLPNAHGQLELPYGEDNKIPVSPLTEALDVGIAQWSFEHATPAGIGTDTLPANNYFYLPLVAPMRTRGVLVLKPQNRRWILIPEQRQHLDTFAALVAIALERVHYIDIAQDVLLKMESERLRNSLLSALSHDLRTPLTSLVGLSESLACSKPALAPQQQEFANALHEETLRMSQLVVNLMDMARFESGNAKLRLEWQPFEEVVGSALRASRMALVQHRISTSLHPELPLVLFDAVLIERVLCNLLENASKYTPPDTEIVISAECSGNDLTVVVYDSGPGLPPAKVDNLFDKFTRGERESAVVGVGLGLAICKAIVQAHGGSIRSGISPKGGAALIFTLPLGVAPAAVPLERETVLMPGNENV